MGYGGSLHGSGYGGALHGVGLHAFDTGLHRAQRTTIREALVARLEAKLIANGGYLRFVKMLPRPLRAEGDEDGIATFWKAVQGNTPSLAIALGRKTYEATDTEALLQRGELEFFVYAVSTHGRDTVEGRLAADVAADASVAADPGLETILEHVEELLLGQELNIKGISEIRAIEEDELATFDDCSIWELKFAVKVERQIKPTRASTRIVTSLQGDHRPAEIPAVHPLSPTVRSVAELEEG